MARLWFPGLFAAANERMGTRIVWKVNNQKDLRCATRRKDGVPGRYRINYLQGFENMGGGWGVLIKSLRGAGSRLTRFHCISPLLPSSSPCQYARTEGYLLHGEIAIWGARPVEERETDGRDSRYPTLSPRTRKDGAPSLVGFIGWGTRLATQSLLRCALGPAGDCLDAPSRSHGDGSGAEVLL